MTRATGLGDEPRRIFEELCKIILTDVVLPTLEKTVETRRRCVARPTEPPGHISWTASGSVSCGS